MKPGPYQYCDECETERSHNWKDKEDIFVCVTCGKETKIKPRPAIPRETIFPGLGKITPTGTNEMDHIDQPLIDEINQSKKPVQEAVKKPAQKKEEGITAFEPELPKMGHEIKATPLDDLRGKRIPGLIFEESGPFLNQVGSMVAGQSPLNSIVMRDELSDVTPEMIDEVNKGMKEASEKMSEYLANEGTLNYGTSGTEEVKPKPATGGWADAL